MLLFYLFTLQRSPIHQCVHYLDTRWLWILCRSSSLQVAPRSLAITAHAKNYSLMVNFNNITVSAGDLTFCAPVCFWDTFKCQSFWLSVYLSCSKSHILNDLIWDYHLHHIPSFKKFMEPPRCWNSFTIWVCAGLASSLLRGLSGF